MLSEAQRRPFSERDLAIIEAFRSVTFPLGTNQKRFTQQMIYVAEHSRDVGITERQARYLTILAWRFRRQMPATLAYPVIEGDEGLVHGFESPAGRLALQDGQGR